jgi:spore maturation protein CgeB
MSTWIVIRTDDNGYETVMAQHLSEQEAVKLVELMTSRGHKQTYHTVEDHVRD